MIRKPTGTALAIAAIALMGILLIVSRGNREAGVAVQAGTSGSRVSPGSPAEALDGKAAATKSADRPEQELATLSTDEPLTAEEGSREPRLANCQEGCTHCANLLKLTDSQTKYADEQWAKILETHRPEASQVEGIRLACRQLADAVMLEWSAENGAPVLQAEATIRALEKEIIAPALAGVAVK